MRECDLNPDDRPDTKDSGTINLIDMWLEIPREAKDKFVNELVLLLNRWDVNYFWKEEK